MSPRWLVVLLCPALGACALLTKGEASQRSYYTPGLELASASAAPVDGGAGWLAGELRLGRVTAGPALDERMMFRDSAVEVGFFTDRRWSERPEGYLRRALARALFGDGLLLGLARGVGPTLEVELVAFEEVRSPVPLGRVTVTWTLGDERVVKLQRTLTAERAVVREGQEPEAAAVARALGEALLAVVGQLRDQVRAALAAGGLR